MRILILKNKFLPEDLELLELAFQGLYKANSIEPHARQANAYGHFSNAIQAIINVRFGKEIGEYIWSMYDFDAFSAAEFAEWLEGVIREHRSEMEAALQEMDAVREPTEVFSDDD